jgi:hypothetical protein
MMSAPAFATHPTSPVDHADVPNCTIFSAPGDNCENVPLWYVTVGFGTHCYPHDAAINPSTGKPYCS